MGGRTLKVYCTACHHVALLTPEALLKARLSAAAKILDLKGRLRCRGCGRKGPTVVSVKWRGQGAEASPLARVPAVGSWSDAWPFGPGTCFQPRKFAAVRAAHRGVETRI